MLTNRKVTLILALAYLVGLAVMALAKPAFMDRYNNDPFSKADLRGKCTVCHVGKGGGERNEFGEAFEDAGYRITPKLRGKFPDLFEPSRTKDDFEFRVQGSGFKVQRTVQGS